MTIQNIMIPHSISINVTLAGRLTAASRWVAIGPLGENALSLLIRAADRGLRLIGADAALLALRSRHSESEIAVLRFIVDPQKSALDVGANQGFYSRQLTNLAARCVAIEPNPGLCKFLKRAIPGLEVIQMALSSKEGLATLRIPTVNGVEYDGWGTIDQRNHFVEIPNCSAEALTVTICRGDNLADSIGCHPIGFIKIDAEGHELAILDGFKRTIQEDRPTFLIEIGLTGCGASLDETLERLPGYLPIKLANGRLIAATSDISGNVIFLPHLA